MPSRLTDICLISSRLRVDVIESLAFFGSDRHFPDIFHYLKRLISVDKIKSMYYLCKFSDSWSVYDDGKKSSRPLTKEEIEIVSRLCPGLFNTDEILLAVEIHVIAPNKLQALHGPGRNGSSRKNDLPVKQII